MIYGRLYGINAVPVTQLFVANSTYFCTSRKQGQRYHRPAECKPITPLLQWPLQAGWHMLRGAVVRFTEVPRPVTLT